MGVMHKDKFYPITRDWKYISTISLTSAVDGVGWSTLRPGWTRLPGKETWWRWTGLTFKRLNTPRSSKVSFIRYSVSVASLLTAYPSHRRRICFSTAPISRSADVRARCGNFTYHKRDPTAATITTTNKGFVEMWNRNKHSKKVEIKTGHIANSSTSRNWYCRVCDFRSNLQSWRKDFIDWFLKAIEKQSSDLSIRHTTNDWCRPPQYYWHTRMLSARCPRDSTWREWHLKHLHFPPGRNPYR